MTYHARKNIYVEGVKWRTTMDERPYIRMQIELIFEATLPNYVEEGIGPALAGIPKLIDWCPLSWAPITKDGLRAWADEQEEREGDRDIRWTEEEEYEDEDDA